MSKYQSKQTIQEEDNRDDYFEEEGYEDIDEPLEPPKTPPTTIWSTWPTPLTIRTRQTGIDYIQRRQQAAIEGRQELSPSVIRVTQKVLQASERSMLAGGLANNRLYDLSLTEEARNRRKSSSNKVVQKYGEIFGHQARRDIQMDDEEEKEVINIRENWQKTKWKEVYKKVLKARVQEVASRAKRVS